MALSGLDGAITLWAVAGGGAGRAISAGGFLGGGFFFGGVFFCWHTSSMTTQSMLRLCSCVLARMPIRSSDESGDASGDKRRVIPFFRKRLRQSTGLLNFIEAMAQISRHRVGVA